MRVIAAILISAFLMVGRAHRAPDAPSPTAGVRQERFVLRVSLFPWIPDAESYAAWIERTFEARNPDIDLVVRPMTKANEVDLSYGIEEARTALTDTANPDYQHVIEIDTLILGSLRGAIQPFEVRGPDYFNFARQAVELGGRTYGVPHWTCGYFIMSTIDGVTEARTASELRTRLAAAGGPHPDLGGDLIGSWGSVMAYLDAYLDTYPNANPAEALDDTVLDARVSAALGEIGSACSSSGTGLCNRDDPEILQMFASGRLDALIGYSERLNAIFANPANRLARTQVRIAPAPLGAGRTSFLFTDALVQSSTCVSARCRDAARRFAEFYVSDAVMEGSMMSADRGSRAVPRYLLPSTRSAMSRRPISQDPIYRQLAPALRSARPYPNQGVPEARERGVIRPAVDALVNPSP
jgi:thiamine pyridinylase